MRTLSCQGRGCVFDPWLGNQDSQHAALHGQKKKKEKNVHLKETVQTLGWGEQR